LLCSSSESGDTGTGGPPSRRHHDPPPCPTAARTRCPARPSGRRTATRSHPSRWRSGSASGPSLRVPDGVAGCSSGPRWPTRSSSPGAAGSS
jgi:hypothetical protein